MWTKGSPIFASQNSMSSWGSPRISSKPNSNFIKNLQRAVSLNSLSLPKISQRSDFTNSSPLLSPASSILQISTSKSPTLPSISSPSSSTSVKSSRAYGRIRAYCANTNKGFFREANEDRAMIISRIPKPTDRKHEKWPPCSFFAIYDGHGGKECANFLRDNLHLFITNDACFPNDPCQAIINGFRIAENRFMEYALLNKKKSGSCAIVLILIGKKGYLANLGDSRAVVSECETKKIIQISVDHKPESEKDRILAAGGEIYYGRVETFEKKSICRVFPGRLSVSRTIGDIDSKIANRNVIISQPEIKTFKIRSDTDFIVLGSDGVFDILTNEEVINAIWKGAGMCMQSGVENKLASGVENVLLETMNKDSSDNVTVIAVAFENFYLCKEEMM